MIIDAPSGRLPVMWRENDLSVNRSPVHGFRYDLRQEEFHLFIARVRSILPKQA